MEFPVAPLLGEEKGMPCLSAIELQVSLTLSNHHCYDKKSDEGSKSVRMRHENSGASKEIFEN